MSYEHLLVAVDLTEECDPVIKRAKAIASASGIRMSAQKNSNAMIATTVPRSRWMRSTARPGQRWRVTSIRHRPSTVPVTARQNKAL